MIALGRRSFCVLAVVGAAIGHACDPYAEQPSAAGPSDGGGTADVESGAEAGPGDGSATGGDADAGMTSCEVASSVPVGVVGGAKALAADAVHVYVAGSSGVLRKTVDGLGAFTDVSVDDANDLLLTDAYVVWRRANGVLFAKAKTNVAADAGVVYGGNANTIAIEPDSSNQFIILRVADVFACPASGGLCAGTILAHGGVTDLVRRGTSFDFVAADVGGVSVFHCAVACDQPDAATRLAMAGQDVPDLVSDDTFVYWVDAPAGRVRRIARAGGPEEDVMTNLVAPFQLALDMKGHIIVATRANGVFRGAAGGRCSAPAGPTGTITALAAGPAGAFITTPTELRSLQ